MPSSVDLGIIQIGLHECQIVLRNMFESNFLLTVDWYRWGTMQKQRPLVSNAWHQTSSTEQLLFFSTWKKQWLDRARPQPQFNIFGNTKRDRVIQVLVPRIFKIHDNINEVSVRIKLTITFFVWTYCPNCRWLNALDIGGSTLSHTFFGYEFCFVSGICNGNHPLKTKLWINLHRGILSEIRPFCRPSMPMWWSTSDARAQSCPTYQRLPYGKHHQRHTYLTSPAPRKACKSWHPPLKNSVPSQRMAIPVQHHCPTSQIDPYRLHRDWISDLQSTRITISKHLSICTSTLNSEDPVQG